MSFGLSNSLCLGTWELQISRAKTRGGANCPCHLGESFVILSISCGICHSRPCSAQMVVPGSSQLQRFYSQRVCGSLQKAPLGVNGPTSTRMIQINRVCYGTLLADGRISGGVPARPRKPIFAGHPSFYLPHPLSSP